MNLLTWIKLLRYRLLLERRKTKLRLVPRDKTTTTPVHWSAQYHYKPTQEKETQP